MDLQIFPDYDAMSEAAAEWVVRSIHNSLLQKDVCVICPSAGDTPMKMYQRLAHAYKNQIPAKKLLIVQMDEYADLPDTSPRRYRNFLEEHLLKPLQIKNSILFQETDDSALKQYVEGLKLFGGIDLFIHGIGENGHLGFNEPGSDFNSSVRQVRLTDSTRNANSRFFESMKDVPKFGVTLGLAEIFSGRQQLVMACGMHKAKALWQLVHGETSPQWPLTCLQSHPQLTVMADKPAAQYF